VQTSLGVTNPGRDWLQFKVVAICFSDNQWIDSVQGEIPVQVDKLEHLWGRVVPVRGRKILDA
jgi:hypothetical protein